METCETLHNERLDTWKWLWIPLLLSVLFAILWITPSSAVEYCEPCDPNAHNATPGSGSVVIFSDSGHESYWWQGEKPYFDVEVECTLCHNIDLGAAHGNDCATCHTSPVDTLGIWGKGCQQGGCHASYHEDSISAHEPFDAPIGPYTDCERCHGPSWTADQPDVSQSSCLNCHATSDSSDTTPPVTSAPHVLGSYVGPARIGFSISDNGKVGVGRTFYQLDGGAVTAAGKNLFITAPGGHVLKFWSMDQSGNTESTPTQVGFNIVADSIPPTTTSNVQAAYYQNAVITLTATDISTLGVKDTRYRINDGPVEFGTVITMPVTSGTIPYTLTYWSEDWSGNIETQHTVNFTVTGGTATFRLVWGDSDVSGSPCPGDPDAEAAWTIRRGTTTVATGSGTCPNWSGVNEVTVPVSATPYSVSVDWWNSSAFGGEGDWDNTGFPSTLVTTPGQVISLSY